VSPDRSPSNSCYANANHPGVIHPINALGFSNSRWACGNGSAASRVPWMKLVKGENRFTRSGKASLKLRPWSFRSASSKGEILGD
jgi:hypothetical protein